MKMLIIVISFILFGCSTKEPLYIEQDRRLIQGDWKNVEDEKWVFHFDSNYFLDSYIGASIDSVLYEIEDKPRCNDKYINGKAKSKGLTFMNTFDPIKKDSTCYEVTSLDSSNLSIRETSNGKTFTFRKVN